MVSRAALAPAPEAALPVIYSRQATPLETLAAREVRRYVYLRTGQLLDLQSSDQARIPGAGAIVIGRKDRPFVADLLAAKPLPEALAALGPEQFWLRSVRVHGRPVVVLAGGDDLGTLYAAYRFAERLGVRFFLHGDVLPDERIALRLPILDERQAPIFKVRGLQPFHDFPEGPDWWNAADYEAVIGQLAKLRMNFIGLHTYPENAPNAEPTVWIGLPRDAGERGRVSFSYPASYQNTRRGNWGYAAAHTSDFGFGAAELFAQEAYGPRVMEGNLPQPETPEGCNQVFNRTGNMLRTAFDFAHRLGVQTCVGTETPLTVPRRVAERLQAQGQDPHALATREQLYEGVFRRIEQAYPVDYYWFWTPEGWTWEGTKEAQVQATVADLRAALTAAKNVAAPFRLATCGWVLGPPDDRALFDRVLPKEVTVSCINRQVGNTPVDPSFAEVGGRGKWAIPWLEDDPGLTAPQLWVGRMRRDAADARRYGCDGLLGIHWRTRVLGPNVSALAQAAWTQEPWNTSPFSAPPRPEAEAGPLGGQIAAFPNNTIAGTSDGALYQTVRYNLEGYHLPVPNGTYRVTLKFCEPHYSAAGKRVFGIQLQGVTVIDRLDIFAQVGQNRAMDLSFDKIAVTNGWLNIGFTPIVEFPAIAALDVEGDGVSRKINCGGPAYRDYAADDRPAATAQAAYAPVADFYADWAQHEFGPDVGDEAAVIFAGVDCHLPRPADWVDGPGGIRPDPRPWEQVRRDYDFVDEFGALRGLVRGAGNRARFDYWLETFRYLRGMARVNCTWAAYNQAVQRARTEPDAAGRQQLASEYALPLRRQLVREVGEVFNHLLATVSTSGELGTVANWEQHLLPMLLTRPGEELASLLGKPLPPDALPPHEYHGPCRVIVPTLRSTLVEGEDLGLKVIILAERPPRDAVLRWRPLGTDHFFSVPLTPLGRGVYSVELPSQATESGDLEWQVAVLSAEGQSVYYPPTAPALNQTVVMIPAGPRGWVREPRE